MKANKSKSKESVVMDKGKSGLPSFSGFHFGGESIASKVKANPDVTMVSLTGQGMQKASQYGVDGKAGDILSYLKRSQPASVREISNACGIEVRTTQNILLQFASSNPPFVIVGGKS